MDKDILRKVQLTQLEIAKEIKRVCDLLSINYFLDFGTLLGAVRHKGFIPWDDDLDIGMLREDYERFLAEAPSVLDSGYFLQSWESDLHYGLAFAKVRKNGTVYIEQAAMETGAHNGIYVDVFPYDAYPNEIKLQKWQGRRLYFIKRAMLIKCGYKPWIMSSGNEALKQKKKIAYSALKFVAFFVSKREMIKKYNEIAQKFNPLVSTLVYANDGATDCGELVIPRECFSSYIYLPFEDDYFKCPADFEHYLTVIYGNYLELPPVEERENRHLIVEVKFEKE